MIDDATVQKIFDAANIVDIIQDFVSLKKAGTNYKGACPFHDEKTPSFVVSPAKGIYKCFGCGAAGNAVKFVMEHEKFSYAESLKYIAKKYNIEVVEKELSGKEIEEKKERESLLIVNEFAKNFFISQLNKSDEGKTIAEPYFFERGFKESTLKKFELGWSPSKRDALTKAATEKGYKINFLETVGLTITNTEKRYSFDRFADRIIFPIHSLAGKTIGFGGRTLRADKKIAKYLNSPESEIYNKSKVLYGLFFAKNSIVKHNKCYMVEGYTDVISMHQSGIENVVASSGTSLTESQIKLVRKFTENLTIIYDGDFAGIKASLRGIDMVLSEGMNVKIVLLPEGEDPDSFSKKMKFDDFQKYIDENEEDFIKFKTKLLLEESKSDPIKRASLITDIVKSIAVINNTILRAEYIKECSNIIKIREEVLYAEVKKIANEKLGKKVAYTSKTKETLEKTVNPIKKSLSDPIEKDIIYYLLNYGNEDICINSETKEKTSVAEYIISQVLSDELEFTNNIYRIIFDECAKLVAQNGKIELSILTTHKSEEISAIVSDIISPVQELSKIWMKNGASVMNNEADMEEVIPGIIDKFKLKNVQNRISKIVEDMKNTPPSDKNKFNELFDEFNILNEFKVALTKQIDKSALL